jgi:hypothetical protein
MTDQRNILWDFMPDSSTPRYVTGIGGTQLLTAGQGDIRAKTTIDGAEVSLIINGALFVPKGFYWSVSQRRSKSSVHKQRSQVLSQW